MARDPSYGVLALCLFAVLTVAGSTPLSEIRTDGAAFRAFLPRVEAGLHPTHVQGEAAAPLNVNRATPVQLQRIAGLLRQESAVLIAYRAKAPCKTLDDLKAVAGLDFTKIEKRRDRLVCY